MSKREATITVTPAELAHLASLVWRNEEDGVYYGPNEQYWRRHNRIVRKLKDADEQLSRRADAAESEPRR